MSKTFIKKPVPIEAMRFDGENYEEIRRWQYPHVKQVGNPAVWFHPLPDLPDYMGKSLFKNDLEVVAVVWDYLHATWVGVKVGQWIMFGTEGEFYPCADDGTGTAPMNYEEKS